MFQCALDMTRRMTLPSVYEGKESVCQIYLIADSASYEKLNRPSVSSCCSGSYIFRATVINP